MREMGLEEIREIFSKVVLVMYKLGYKNLNEFIEDFDRVATLSECFKQIRPLLSLKEDNKGRKSLEVREWKFQPKERNHEKYYDLFLKGIDIVDKEKYKNGK